MKRIILSVLFVFIFFGWGVSDTFAADSFSISTNVDYTVSSDNTTHTALHIGLTNTTSQYYASEYTIRIGFTNIDNVKAFDPDGTIIPIVTKGSDGYTIKVEFNKHVVGIGNTLPFTIEFDTPDIVQQQGSIYEVDIPGIANQNDFSAFNVHVHVPSYYGVPTYIKPNTGTTALDFTKEQLGSGGVSIGFGESAMYTFTLTYHLGNKNVFPIRTELALPSNTSYQTVSIDDISEKPTNVIIDEDGNWLAQYSLYPSQRKTIVVKGKVAVSLSPKQEEETQKTLNLYLQPKMYWEAKNQDIIALATKLKTPRAIYDYVVKTLSYDFSRVTNKEDRLGAAAVFIKPKSAVCLEFTDLFIAIARAAGIPAREVDGFAYAKNPQERPVSVGGDILHAWPEYYDSEKKTWVMIDPTWGNTTDGVDYFDVFDFNHIAFVIKGVDSNYPVPAGGYKLVGDDNIKQVEVIPANTKTFPPATAYASVHIGEKVFAGIPVSGFIRLQNQTGILYPSQPITFAGINISPKNTSATSASIPPFGYIDVPVSFEKTSFLTHKNATITVLVNGKAVSQTIQIIPFYLVLFEKQVLPWTIGGGVVIACISIIIWIIATGARDLSVSGRK